jgi:hypothetical protein
MRKSQQCGDRRAIGAAVDAFGPPVTLESHDHTLRRPIVGASGVQSIAVVRERRLQPTHAWPFVAEPKSDVVAEWLRRNPVSDASLPQSAPVEKLAGVVFAQGSDIGVAEDPLRPYAASFHDILAQRYDSHHLGLAKWLVAMADARIVDLYPN